METLRELSVDRYNQCERETKRRFDLRDISVFIYSSHDQDGMGVVGTEQVSKEHKQISTLVNKCGGRIRLVADETVNLCVIEMHRLQAIIERFDQWRRKQTATLDDSVETVEESVQNNGDPRYNAQGESEAANVGQKQQRGVARSKREL